ncbi:MAG: hypothetical protein EXR77_00415 [Myxococcales bacterium]|nr:hypothetical protein [Myxococcales bacterium]
MAFFEQFAAWMPEDFAAWQPAKRASNRFTPERSRVRERLKSLVEQALLRQSLQRGDLELWASKAEPHFFNDHVVDHAIALLARPQAFRDRLEALNSAVSSANPEKFHAHIGVRVDVDGVVIELSAPAGAAFELEAARAAVHDWSMWAELLGWALPASDARDVSVARRWSVQEALDWADPIGDVGMWASQALPALAQLLEQTDKNSNTPPSAALPVPAAAALPPATIQAPPRQWQPYRPTAPAPPRRAPIEPRPSLIERIVPYMQAPPEPPPLHHHDQHGHGHERREPPRDRGAEGNWQGSPPAGRHRDTQWRPDSQRQPDRPEAHGPPDTRGGQRSVADPRMGDGRPRPDSRLGDPGSDARGGLAGIDQRRRHPDEHRPPDRGRAPPRSHGDHQSSSRPPAAPPPPQGPQSGALVVLTGGLLAGKEGQVVANLGRTIKVRVGKLEFELPAYQVQAAA